MEINRTSCKGVSKKGNGKKTRQEDLEILNITMRGKNVEEGKNVSDWSDIYAGHILLIDFGDVAAQKILRECEVINMTPDRSAIKVRYENIAVEKHVTGWFCTEKLKLIDILGEMEYKDLIFFKLRKPKYY